MQQQSLPVLEIHALSHLILHEDVENHRVERIMARLQADGVIMNPPIAARVNGHRRLIVLDGASRVTASRRLGFPHLMVQVVDYPDRAIGLDRWHHLVVGMSLEELAERCRALEGVELERSTWSATRTLLENRKVLAALRTPGKRPILLRTRGRRRAFAPIRELTTIYATDPGLHRVRDEVFDYPEEWLGEDRVLVLFPRFRQKDIVRFALGTSERLPMGITRHTVPNRALRVFYPTDILRAPLPLARKRAHLRSFLEDKWERGRIRFYPEPTTLYDE